MAEYSISEVRLRPMMLPFLFGLVLLASAGAPARAENPPPLFPDLEMAGADGGSIRLSQLKGNVILVNVWATWCGPCRLELPIVQRMYDKYSDRNFVVLAVNVDADRKRIDPFMKRNNISLPVYYASPEDAGQMTAGGIPSTFIIGPDRTLLDHVVGYSAEAEERWKQVIEKRLKARKTR
ncbi:MAG TPA: TlpA disulfide reductase family protein [Thermoanaerobaculia bacterium]|nr:TlpA disulfide reductase family protein [Thermoanaerobaculia bacterium]